MHYIKVNKKKSADISTVLFFIAVFTTTLSIAGCKTAQEPATEQSNEVEEYSIEQYLSAADASFRETLNQIGLKATIEEYKSLVLLYPEDPFAHFFLGFAYIMQAGQISSLDAWESNKQELSGIYSNYVDPEKIDREQTKRSSESKESRNKAIECYEKSLDLCPDLYIANLTLGNIFFEDGEYEKSVFHYRELFEKTKDPKFAAKLAGALRYQGNVEEARKLCEDVLSGEACNTPELYNQLALACMELKDFDNAISYGQKAIEMRPGNVDAYISLAKIYREAELYEKSLAVCDEGLELNPFIPVLYSSKGVNYDRLKRFDESLKYHRKVLELDPYYYKAYNNIGCILSQQGKSEEAILAYKKAARHLDYGYIHVNLATELYKLGRSQECIDVAKNYLKIDPNNKEMQTVLANELCDQGKYEEAEAYINSNSSDEKEILPLIRIRIGQKRWKEAEILARKALASHEEKPNNLNSELKASELEHLAVALLNQDKLKEALSASLEAEDLTTNKELKISAAAKSAFIFNKMGQKAEELSALERTISYDPENIDAYLSLTAIAFNIGNNELALKYCEPLLEKDPTNPLGLEMMGAIHRYSNPNLAIQYFIKSWNADNRRIEPLYTLCELLLIDHNETNKAEPIIQELETRFPNSWQTFFIQGIYLGNTNRQAESIQFLKKASELESRSHIFNCLGYTYFLLKEYELADESYIKALSFNDHSTGIVYYNRALLYKAKGDPEKALEFLDLSVKNGYPEFPKTRSIIMQMIEKKDTNKTSTQEEKL